MTDPPRLEAAFTSIHVEKMRSLAFVNPALRVEAIAFAPWKHYWLGVMLTPWAMYLLLAPREIARWLPLPAGEKRRYAFPAGDFDFISARDDTIGEFLICSLYSPVLQFADHATAGETARLVREALFDATHAEAEATTVPGRPLAVDDRPGTLAQIEAQLETPLSRRELFHGHLRKRAQ